ncbi:MAG: peptidoglycan DD-metalloendopeptidase family protein [Hyphomicrobiales bacterium]
MKKTFQFFVKRISLPIIMGLAVLGCNSPTQTSSDQEKPVLEKDTIVKVPTIEWGINVDSLDIQNGTIEKNQFLSDLLQSYGVDYGIIDQLAKKSRDIYDVRKIRAGKPYAVISTKDTTKSPLYFIYEPNPIDYVVYQLTDSLDITIDHNKVDTRIETTSGKIKSSFWNAMVENNTDPNLSNKLSEIFAWSIDFFGIQSGDEYRIVYENKYVKDEPVGLGRILSADIKHMGENNYAFWFEPDSLTSNYFDEKAGSLRRSFLKAPLTYSRISSRFSNSRLHPVLKIRRPHHGVDYAAPRGTPVLAVGDGTVTKAVYSGGAGRMVKIKHNSTYTTAYLHLSKFGSGIKSGKRVKQGDIIGYVGSSGLSTGPHLDFRFYRNGQPLDPLKVKSPPAKPIDSIHLVEFNQLKDSMIMVLQNIPIKQDNIDIEKDTFLLTKEEPDHSVE